MENIFTLMKNINYNSLFWHLSLITHAVSVQDILNSKHWKTNKAFAYFYVLLILAKLAILFEVFLSLFSWTDAWEENSVEVEEML